MKYTIQGVLPPGTVCRRCWSPSEVHRRGESPGMKTLMYIEFFLLSRGVPSGARAVMCVYIVHVYSTFFERAYRSPLLVRPSRWTL